jgi:hypothetical protein
LSLGYTESDGHPALRKEIAGLYESVRPEEVLVLVPQEAIQIAARQFPPLLPTPSPNREHHRIVRG